MSMTETWPALLGRQRECDTLTRLVEAVRAGRGRSLALHGPAGIGKTALLSYLTERAAGCRVARAAGVPSERGLAFAGLHQLCGPFLDHRDRLPEPQREALGTIFGLSPGAAPDPLLLGLAVLTLLGDAAREQPLICVIEDAHWLDHSSAQILEFVARRLTAEPVALVLATRTPFPGFPELPLRALTDRDSAELLQALVPGPLDPRVRDRILAESRGNPRALRSLPATGLAYADDDRPAPEIHPGSRHLLAALDDRPHPPGAPQARPPLSGPGAPQPERGPDLPAAGPAAVAAPLDRAALRPLPASARSAGAEPAGGAPELGRAVRLLLLVAAAEPTGDVPLLWRAAGRLGLGVDAVAAAEEAELIELGDRVRLRHPLDRAAVYRAASRAQRRAVHEALAEVTDPGADPDRRAWHRAHAMVGPDEAVAADLERSAGRALDRGGPAAAASFLATAAALTPDPARRARRSLEAAHAKAGAGAYGDALSVLAAAEAGPLDEPGRARAELLRARIALRADGDATLPRLLSAARRLEPIDEELAREAYLDALSMAALTAPVSTQLRGTAPATRPRETAPATAQPGKTTPPPETAPATAQPGRTTPPPETAPATAQPGRTTPPPETAPATARPRETAPIAAGNARLREAALAVRRGRRPGNRGELLLDGLAALWSDGYATAVPVLRAAVRGFGGEPLSLREAFHGGAAAVGVAAALWDDEHWDLLSRRHLDAVLGAGAPGLLPPALAGRAVFAVHSGDLAGAAALVARGRWVSATTGQPFDPLAEVWLAAVRGDEQHGERLIAGALDDAKIRGIDPGMIHAARAVLLNGLGRYEEAAAEPGGPAWVLAELVEAGVRGGDTALAGRAFEQLAAVTTAGGTDLALGVEAARRALLRTGRTAEDLYREAIDRLGRTRIRVERARAKLRYGEWLRRAGRRADARVQLRQAYEEMAAMGAAAFAGRARRELLATGETVRKRTVGAEGELTAQEEQIAGLAVQGLTNPEIAATLFISPRTVEWHLRKVFTKLGVGTRRELRRALPRRQAQAPA